MLKKFSKNFRKPLENVRKCLNIFQVSKKFYKSCRRPSPSQFFGPRDTPAYSYIRHKKSCYYNPINNSSALPIIEFNRNSFLLFRIPYIFLPVFKQDFVRIQQDFQDFLEDFSQVPSEDFYQSFLGLLLEILLGCKKSLLYIYRCKTKR